MHSTQYTALARALDQEGLTIAAMHHLPGAMQDADGVYVLAYNPDLAQEASYCIISYHVGFAPEDSWKYDAADKVQVHELSCGDRHWQPIMVAWDDFARRVANDVFEFLA